MHLIRAVHSVMCYPDDYVLYDGGAIGYALHTFITIDNAEVKLNQVF